MLECSRLNLRMQPGFRPTRAAADTRNKISITKARTSSEWNSRKSAMRSMDRSHRVEGTAHPKERM